MFRAKKTARQPTQGLRDSLALVLREYSEALIIAVVIALILRGFVLSSYRIPTDTMAPTLKAGDFIMGYKLPFGVTVPFSGGAKLGGGLPERGEVVIFNCPDRSSVQCVKRVVGLPGDRIQIIKKRLVVNGEVANYTSGYSEAALDLPGGEFYVAVSEKLKSSEREILISKEGGNHRFGPYVVPPGHVFVLGDNRDFSEDSRFWGPVPTSHLRARVLFIWMSLNWMNLWANNKLPSLRWQRILKSVN